MNKKRIIITGLLFVLTGAVLSLGVFAQSPTPTKVYALDKEVESLKEKIADKVSELKKDGGSIIAGTISSIGKDSLELSAEGGKTFKVTIDDTVTSFNDINGSSKDEIELKDLEKGDFIFVSGPLVESTIAANGIYRDTPYIVGSGQITAVDTDAVSLDIVTTNKDELTVDISKRIRPKIMDSKTLEIERTTLAKIKAGDTIHFVITATDDKSTVNAVSILVIPQEFF